jgi:ribosomal protein L11 methyltransferase
MPQSQLSVPLTKDQAYALVDAVMERHDLALSASAEEDAEGNWVFEATCETPPDIEAFNALAQQTLGGEIDFEIEKIDPNIDWVAKSLEGLKPVHAGGFYVFGSHDTHRPPAGAIPLHIEAAQAFGTGHHETTTGCLIAIDRVLKRKNPRYLLDIGTGTGILAMALAKRRHLPVIASDIDPVAVDVARRNARLNEVSNDMVAVEATGVANRVIAENGPYDLIVANILAGPLAEMASDIGSIAAPGASLVLSGILVPQAVRVLAAYRQQGIVLTQRIIRGEWITLILEKPSGSKTARCRA